MASSPFSILNFGLIGDNESISVGLSMTGMPLTEECCGELDSTVILPFCFFTTVSIVVGCFSVSFTDFAASEISNAVVSGASVPHPDNKPINTNNNIIFIVKKSSPEGEDLPYDITSSIHQFVLANL